MACELSRETKAERKEDRKRKRGSLVRRFSACCFHRKQRELHIHTENLREERRKKKSESFLGREDWI